MRSSFVVCMSARRKALNDSAVSPLNPLGSRVTMDSGTSGEFLSHDLRIALCI